MSTNQSTSHSARSLFFLYLTLSGSLGKGIPVSSRQDNGVTAKDMFDAMQQLMTGEEEFEAEYWGQLTTCWDMLNPRYWEAQDKAWAGMVQYHDQDGVPGDRWGECLDEGHCMSYLEKNDTVQDFHDITIYEPCGYASNIAYYYVSTEICEHYEKGQWYMRQNTAKAMAEIMSSLAFGSAFWHGSHTYAGNVCDNRIIGVLSFIMYQEATINLNPQTPVLKDLALDFRPYSGVEISDQVTNLFLTEDVVEWADFILGIDMPNYYRSFGGIVVTLLTYTVDDATADEIIDALAVLFSFPDEEYEFVQEHLLPEMRAAASDLNISAADKRQLQKNFTSALLKLLYAFVVHEWIITDAPVIFTPEFNEAWTAFQPVLNGFANTMLNDFPNYDRELQTGTDIYPGDTWCNGLYPHAKWHLQAAPGLQDLIYLTDDLYRHTVP